MDENHVTVEQGSDQGADLAKTDVKEEKKLSNRLKNAGNAIKQSLGRFKSPRFSAAYITKLAFLTAIAFVLYTYAKFPLPMLFPSFLDVQISELPALLAGFSMGPLSGALVIVLKCLLKMAASPSMTGYAGELTDILLGILFVVPASLVYRLRADKTSRKSGMVHALVGLVIGTAVMSAMSLVVNRFISIPIYSKLFGFDNIVGMIAGLYGKVATVTADNFYTFYLLVGVLPFNVFRCIIISLITFLLYKRLSAILHWDGTSLKKTQPLEGKHVVKSLAQTERLAARLAQELDGGEIILLDGDLGAGKTTFTKGLAKALGVKQEVTSPTFTILNVYEGGRLKLNHLDMYRIEDEDEVAEFGLDGCFDDESVTVIEWNKLSKLDGEVYRVRITPQGDKKRLFEISCDGDKAPADDLESDGDKAPADDLESDGDKATAEEVANNCADTQISADEGSAKD